MPGQGRLGDKAQVPLDAHGCPACPHPGIGPAIAGSSNVVVNGRPALRVGDPGVHTACCGANTWNATKGSATVFVNGKSAHRIGDATRHCGGDGTLVEGSPNVMVGEETATPTARRASDRVASTRSAGGIASSGMQMSDGSERGERTTRGDAADARSSPAASALRAQADTARPTDFIELKLVDTLGRPMANERYVVIARDGSVKDGRLDAQGFARIDGVVPGTCKVQFPDRHAGDWGRV